jgi:hypothetical protein
VEIGKTRCTIHMPSLNQRQNKLKYTLGFRHGYRLDITGCFIAEPPLQCTRMREKIPKSRRRKMHSTITINAVQKNLSCTKLLYCFGKLICTYLSSFPSPLHLPNA